MSPQHVAMMGQALQSKGAGAALAEMQRAQIASVVLSGLVQSVYLGDLQQDMPNPELPGRVADFAVLVTDALLARLRKPASTPKPVPEKAV